MTKKTQNTEPFANFDLQNDAHQLNKKVIFFNIESGSLASNEVRY